ncbi:MAG: efflux RND transporter periplasmic adaptor subunit, partial [Candidatus Gracilibacteria bacterium]|nr:efflux RND transporter periplasmic adaptor subunit [Candidatus Gracilibacteria bacterium]
LGVLAKDIALYEELVSILNNSITSSSFTQTQLDGLGLNVAKYQGLLLQSQSQMTTLKNTLATTQTSIETNRTSLENALDIANTQLNNIKAGNTSQLDSLSGNEALTQTQLENTIATVKQSRDSVDNAVKIAQSNYDSINAKLNSQRIQAKSQVDQAKGGKDLAGISLNNTSIIAPFDGVVTAKNIEIGSLVNPGTPAFTIGTDDNLKVKLEVSGDNITYLQLGQESQTSKGNNTFTGIITLLSPASDPVTKMFKTEVSFNKKPTGMNLGDYVDVIINKVNSTEKMLLVPFSSIISLGQGDYSVFVVENEIVKVRQIKIGSQNSTQVQILSGVKEGEKIVISGTLDLQDGDLIE